MRFWIANPRTILSTLTIETATFASNRVYEELHAVVAAGETAPGVDDAGGERPAA